MSNSLQMASLFLITTIFDIYLYILIIRLILVWVRSDYFNPITQFITKCTDFIIRPLRRIIPNIGNLETSSLVLLLVLELIKFLLLTMISVGTPNFIGLPLLAIGDAVKILLSAFFYGILLQAILSWIQPHSPVSYLLYQFNSPVMRPFQRVIPPVAGVDISPIPALIVLQLLIIIIVYPLMSIGWNLALGS